MPTRCNRFFIADLIACSTCFGHHYAHHQELKSIIQWLLPVVFRAVVFKLLFWCGAKGYVSGLQDAAASCKPDTCATCPAHLILPDFTTRTISGKEYRSLRSSLCNFLHSPVTSSLLGPSTLLNTLFSNTLSLHSSLNVSDKVSHPYRTTVRDNAICSVFLFVWPVIATRLSFRR